MNEPLQGRPLVRSLVAAWRIGDEDLPSLEQIDRGGVNLPAPPPSVLDNSRKLGGLVEKSLNVIDKILDVELPPEHSEDFVPIAKLHLSAADKVLSTQVRVDENVLKRRAVNAHGALLAQLLEAEKELPAVLDAAE